MDFSCFSEEGTKCVHKLARFCAQVTPEDKGKAPRLHSQEKKLGLGTQVVMLFTRHEAFKMSLLKILV